MSASTIIKFNKLQERARKSRSKVEISRGLPHENRDYYAIGPVTIHNFDRHLEITEKDNYAKCRIHLYDTLKEVEAHLNGFESLRPFSKRKS